MIPDFFVIVGSYVAVFLLATVVYNFLMAGFLRTYLVVKGSRGAKVLIAVATVSRNYYRTGHVEDGFLVYKDMNKHEKRLAIDKKNNPFYRSLNVTCVTVDEERNIIVLPQGQELQGFDAEKYNSLYLRALYRPNVLDPKMQLMFFLSIVSALLGLATVGILMFMVNKKLDTQIELTRFIIGKFANATTSL